MVWCGVVWCGVVWCVVNVCGCWLLCCCCACRWLCGVVARRRRLFELPPSHSHQTWRHHFGYLQRGSRSRLPFRPRMLEFLTTLTFGALGRNHTVSTAFETIAKKHRDREGSSSTCDQPFVVSRELTFHDTKDASPLFSSLLFSLSCPSVPCFSLVVLSLNQKSNSAIDSPEDDKGNSGRHKTVPAQFADTRCEVQMQMKFADAQGTIAGSSLHIDDGS